jgi:hypothetical protein
MLWAIRRTLERCAATAFGITIEASSGVVNFANQALEIFSGANVRP